MMTVIALTAFGAMVAAAQAENQTPSPPTASHPAKKRAMSQTAHRRQVKRANSFDECEKKAHDIGLAISQAGHTTDITQCMGQGPFEP